ncbi:hypothetical protein EKO27_g6653 [Xylaria grammica]|uniref:Transmembrane protein n=1 Tax=Xylaria grammica TaxID=363999 RepID=A0A439D1Z2_9PEZI|nr:hypothetical protein EKO27_g6653 [Xylaria grammica]
MTSSENVVSSSETATSDDTTHSEAPQSTSRRDSLTSSEQAKPPISDRLPLRESLGWTGAATIFGGSILIIASIGFLSLLWFGYGDRPEAASAPWIWRQIAVHDWMTRTITISALVLRSVVSLQVALCTSMIAALVLEKRSTRKSDVAYLSIARSISDGPRKVVQLLLSSRSWSVLIYAELWLLCLLASVMLALQFSSTLLLSDIHDFIIVSDVEARPVQNRGSFTGLRDNGVQTPTLVSNDPTYAVFGEERSTSNMTPTASGFSDTGIIRRGYLPFIGSENRTSVREYRGSTLVTNSRIVCVPPQIQGHIIPQTGLEYSGVLCVLTLDVRTCLLIAGVLENVSAQSNLCFIETVGVTTDAISILYSYELLEFLNTESEPWSLNSTMFLIFRSTLTTDDLDEIVDAYPIPPAEATGEWNRYEVLNGGFVDVSLCFTRFYIESHYVNMTAQRPTREPIVIWDGFTAEHDTTAASAFIGLESPMKPPRDRGLMDMEILAKSDESVTGPKAIDGLTSAELSAVILQTSIIGVTTNLFLPGSISGCLLCNDYSFATSQEFGLLFSDIIESTGRAASALHAFIALASATVYDTYLKAFNITELVDISVTTLVRTPGPCSKHRCSGFITVTALLCAHLVIVMVITALFVGQVRYSRCSNTWHAVAQLISEELEDVLDKSNNAKDGLITKALRSDGKDDFVKLGLTSGSARVQIFKQAGGCRKQREH